jgi:hypothetical protein
MLTPEREAIVEDTYLSLVNDREMYLFGKNFFTKERLEYSVHKLNSHFSIATYDFRVRLGKKYIGFSKQENLEVMEKVYHHLFGKELYPKVDKDYGAARQQEIIEHISSEIYKSDQMRNMFSEWFSPFKVEFTALSALRREFANECYSFIASLGTDYVGGSYSPTINEGVMLRTYFLIFGKEMRHKELENKEPTTEELEMFIPSLETGTCKTNNPCSEISLEDTQSNLTPDPKANKMSVESQNVNVPVAQVTLVYGKEIKAMGEGELISLIEQIEGKKKAFESLDSKSAYYKAQVTKINDAKAMVAAELDSRV